MPDNTSVILTFVTNLLHRKSLSDK